MTDLEIKSDVAKNLEYLKIRTTILRPCLYDLCNIVLNNPAFVKGYGSAGQHHAYAGGLVTHTAEVLMIALAQATAFPECDLEVLITSTIFHDYLKKDEYIPEEAGEGTYSDGKPVLFKKTPIRKMVRHVAGSYAEFVKLCATQYISEESLSSEMRMHIAHCMLAHHGRKEWGSPVEPITVEATILHFADMLSTHFGEGR